MPRSVKIGLTLIVLHFAAFAYATVAKPEYDGRDFPALIFWIAFSKILLIAGGLTLVFGAVQWFVNRQNDGL